MENLTKRETSVLRYVCQGLNNKEIAKHMFISHHTVKVYMSTILRKFGVENRTLAAFIAGKYDLVHESISRKECA